MKKLLNLVIIGIMLFGSNMYHISASTNDGDQIGISEDGTNIVVNESVVNGGVDLNTPLSKESLEKIDKTTNPTTRASSVVLNIPFQTQQTNYYCGPAAAVMVLGAIGYNRTQSQMASLLGTTTNGTNAGNNVANALNSVVAGSKYRFYWKWHNYTDTATIKSKVVEALNYGNPVMVNTAESPGDVYIKGHDIGTALYHFGVVGDYFNYGNSVTYVDPGYGRFSGFLMNQTLSIQSLSNAVGGRGYA